MKGLIATSVFLHWNEGLDSTTTDWTCVLGVYEGLSTGTTDTQMTAWHDESVFGVFETNETFLLGVVDDCLISFLHVIFIRKPID